MHNMNHYPKYSYYTRVTPCIDTIIYNTFDNDKRKQYINMIKNGPHCHPRLDIIKNLLDNENPLQILHNHSLLSEKLF